MDVYRQPATMDNVRLIIELLEQLSMLVNSLVKHLGILEKRSIKKNALNP